MRYPLPWKPVAEDKKCPVCKGGRFRVIGRDSLGYDVVAVECSCTSVAGRSAVLVAEWKERNRKLRLAAKDRERALRLAREQLKRSRLRSSCRWTCDRMARRRMML